MGTPNSRIGPRPGDRRAVDAEHTSRIRAAEIEFVAHPSLDDPGLRAEILGSGPEPDDGEGLGARPAGDGPGRAPRLGRAQEAHLSRQMNYLKHRAERLRRRLDPSRPHPMALGQIERLRARAEAIRDRFIRSNQGLVVAVAKRHVGPTRDLSELFAEGQVPLIRAVDRFDFDRGCRFSTYATWAVTNHLRRLARVERRRLGLVATGCEQACAMAADHRADELLLAGPLAQARTAVHRLLARLDDRERRIPAGRFGLGGPREQTLADLGRQLGVSKERVRQIERRARERLGQMALAERIDLQPA